MLLFVSEYNVYCVFTEGYGAMAGSALIGKL